MELKDFSKDICIGFEITRDCNMTCSYCYVRTRKSKEELETNDWFKLTDILLKKYKGHNISFHLAGGEIFLKKDVSKLIEYIIKKNCFVSVVSNGLYIPEEIYTHKLFKLNKGFFQIAISMDGLREEHHLTRKDFNQVLLNFERLIKSKINSSIKVTVHKNNIKGMIKFNEFINKIGEKYNAVISIEVQPLSIGPKKEIRKKIKSFNKIRVSLKDYLKAAFETTRYSNKKLKFIENDWRFIGELSSFKKISAKDIFFESAYFGCATGNGFDVNANGDFVVCEMDLPAYNIKNCINSSQLDRALNKLKEKMKPTKKCFNCYYKSICGMCRIPPLIHGYPEGFGYKDCQKFMRDISLFYEKNMGIKIAYGLDSRK
ncbi:MAG TPA: radical SAM protein [Nitrospinota bacterium]|nr:radical SAM protein [Nitrospinota bacterium]